MTIKQEMFRFVNSRRPERVRLHRVDSRFVRDLRPTRDEGLLAVLFGPGPYEPKLAEAETFARGARFVEPRDASLLALEPAVDVLRERLEEGVDLQELADALVEELPSLPELLSETPPAELALAVVVFTARLWDTMYALTILGFDRYVSTNYCADALRCYHVLRVWWLAAQAGATSWPGGRFDDYEVLIDLDKAADPGSGSRTGAAVAGLGGSTLASALAAPSFRVPLTAGRTPPPAIGDLIVVEEELSRYDLSEIADVTSVMRSERREQTTRNLSRTSQTTSLETVSEDERTSSVQTAERFQLSSQAEQSASQNFGIQAGVTATGKFGPVQVSATVNASYDTSTSSSTSTAQEYAKAVTEEASRRIRNSIKQVSSTTVLTESQQTTLRGFNNENGSDNINGVYRWLDRIYRAKLMNYGRRLLIPMVVPEPSAVYLSRLSDLATTELADLTAPVHPSRLSRSTREPLPDDQLAAGFRSFHDIDETNYAELGAVYDVAGLEAPPALDFTGSKAFVYPEAMEAEEVSVHDQVNELSLVRADNTLTLEPGYRLTSVTVTAPKGSSGELGSYADALKLGMVAGPKSPQDGTTIPEADLLLVQVGTLSFFLTVRRGDPDPDLQKIVSNFGEWLPVNDHTADWPAYGEEVRPVIPITVTAKFEGIYAFTVIYQAQRTDAALDDWKARAFAAILKGYQARLQEYEQSLALARAKVATATEDQTFALRADQYRAIEVTELKRSCIDLMTQGTAAGHTSITIDEDGTPRIVYDEAEGALLQDWRHPLSNGAVVEAFEHIYEWPQITYEFHPYYWAGTSRWSALAQAAGADPVFEQFLRSGSASVVVPVLPGHERAAILFRRTGRLWAGGYCPLFTDQEMLDVYADVELALQLDPAQQIGETWEVRVPTSMLMLQEDDVLPEFPEEEEAAEGVRIAREPVIDKETVPF